MRLFLGLTVCSMILEPNIGRAVEKARFDERQSSNMGYLVVLRHDPIENGAAHLRPGLRETLQARVGNTGKQTLWHHFRHIPMALVHSLSSVQYEILAADPDVEAVFRNEDVTYDTTNIDLIEAPQIAGLYGFDGSGTTIAVVDTGVDISKSVFGSCSAVNAPGCRVTALVDIADSDGANDDDGHGTNVAGIAATVASGARIIGLDVFTRNGANENHSSTADEIDALDWVLDNWQANNIVAVNLSLGGNDASAATDCSIHAGPMASAYAQLQSVGIVITVSAGNDATETLSQEACDSHATVVGAIYDHTYTEARDYAICTDTAPHAFTSACFSNSNDWVTLFAPGVQINAGGSTLTGTSQATPHAAGAVAVLWGLIDGSATLPARRAKILASLASSRTLVTDWASRQAPALNLVDAIIWGSDTTYSRVQNVVAPLYFVDSVHHVGDSQLMDLMSFARYSNNDALRSRALAPLVTCLF